ncbi:single-stranded-DNA-specific exonuclease RecJ [Bacterioplanoides sp. SCSIO 12839]|uniref:single-stranded-DNA-specific exonuclease RecJ n=1 Tax=Bacterioplanoides sp. SCSIO 12839 TaxID=2829569 RepID=UPI0021029D82|nr:single-stranded-DNA-specific exonuclease RecJ [Bacterioplanoides sp. SCSIO 12839]UTW47344.1 single-stranded-DNA-specific exonuclease RecJ [Bacterioplanoides sp. SCSIO 12839]
MTQIIQRSLPSQSQLSGVSPILQRIYAARGVTSNDQLELQLNRLLPWQSLKGIEAAVDLLVPVVTEQKKLLVVGDFDVDGATSTALAIRALGLFGAQNLDYLVPNRFDFGYGLSPELVAVAAQRQPDLIMTVDNGISSVSGVAAAQAHGIPVLVTDHHLPGDELPAAAAIVNPNQPGCEFASKAACGCTVVFYVMLALRARLSDMGWFADQQAPNMGQLLDLVALATVADVVPLDFNNRILVEQGLRRIRAGQVQPGIQALLQVAGKSVSRVVSSDFGFALGPRINAAGRLDDMSLGIECLLTSSASLALSMAQELDEMNRSRRDIEQGMQHEAMQYVKQFEQSENLPVGLCLYQPDWHQGVIGILASRIKDKVHRPVIAFAADSAFADDKDSALPELKGSARSISGLHMRDVLDEVDKRHPGVIKKFGGHAMAAGLTLNPGGYDTFANAFNQVCATHLKAEQLQQVIESDGELSQSDFTLAMAQELKWAGPWGQAFPEPLFHGEFRLIQQRIVGERHLKLVMQPLNSQLLIDAIYFNIEPTQWPNYRDDAVVAAFQLDVNEFRGEQNVQLLIRHLEFSTP